MTRRGPGTEPWGAPEVTGREGSERLELDDLNTLVRYQQNQPRVISVED